MRLLIDANVYLSYLLKPTGNGSATRVVALIGDGSLEVIFPPQIETELRRTVANKRYLRERIPQDQLEALIEACAAAGRREMVAIIGDSANSGSIRLHEICGFRLVGTLRGVGRKHGRWIDTVLMQRSLRSP